MSEYVSSDQFFTGATAAAPAANTTIANLGFPAAGDYKVSLTTFQAGTVDTNPINIEFRQGSTTIATLPSVAAQFTLHIDRVQFTNVSQVLVRTGAAAGGAGAIYVAFVRIRRIG